MKDERVLVILNYQREIPPFMQMEINEASPIFDEIYYITRKLTNDNRDTVAHNNVSVIEVSNLTRHLLPLLAVIKGLFDSQIFQLRHNFDFRAIKTYFTSYYCALCLYNTAKPLLKKLIKRNATIVVLASWMSSEATATSWLKLNNPQIKALSFAHSFEVIPSRNPYLLCSFHELHHRALDYVYFISRNVMNQYLDGMKCKNIKELYSDRMGVRYLGSSNASATINPYSQSPKLRILTCSRIDENKRLDKIISALADWNECLVEWTIIGDGVSADKIRRQSEQLQTNNKNISIIFVGQKTNREVKDYFSSHTVDLFVNVSYSEGLPVSIMEACSFGVPILATDVGGTSEIVDASNGFLLNRDFSDDDFTNKLRKFALLNQNEILHLRQGSLNKWLKLFDIKKNVPQMYGKWLETFN